jgi:hypothetical protein
MACFSMLGDGRAHAAGFLGALCVLLPQTCFASGPTIDLEVEKTKDAGDCPDAAYLAEATSRVLGRGVLAPPSAAPDLHVEIRFDRRKGLYVATVRASQSRGGNAAGDRSLAHEGATCAPLADAVVATLAVRLDEEETGTENLAPSPAPAPPAPPPSPAPKISSPPAPADPEDSPPSTEPEPERDPDETRWYGWQVLAADASSFAVVALGSRTNTPALGWLGIGGMFLASPIVHGFHDRWGATVASLGMRIGLALVGGVVGVAVAPPCDSSGSFLAPLACALATDAYGIYGAFVGLGVASAVDAVGLSWEHVRVRRTDTSGLRLTPLLSLSRAEGRLGGGTVGVAGEF